MIEKRSIFNFTVVNQDEFESYLNETFIDNDKFKVEYIIYVILFILYNIIFIPSLVLFYKLRDSYIIRQRGNVLTFVGGIVTFIYGFIGFLPQIMKVPCPLNVYNVNVLNIVVMQFFFSRSLRVILTYRFNIYKVTSVGHKEQSEMYYGEKEPNHYLPIIYKKVNKIIFYFILIPSVTVLAIVIIIHMNNYDTCRFNDVRDAMIGLKNNSDGNYFIIIQTFGKIYMAFGIVTAIALIFVNDTSNYGVKFECLSTAIMITIFGPFNGILQSQATKTTDDPNEKHRRFFLDLFEKTKGGKMLFNIIAIYILFSSIILPLIHYWKSKSQRNKYFQSPVNSLQYFYKILNTPALVNELRDIAIKTFSVENVLFWENYQILQRMVYRYQKELHKAIEMGDETMVAQYDFDNYYQQQIKSNYATPSMDSYSYDPTLIVPKEIYPYFKSFYYTFIDSDAPACVNITGKTLKQIRNEFRTYPTVGMFDNAKNEIVEIMYSSLFPILLRNNKRHFKPNPNYR